MDHERMEFAQKGIEAAEAQILAVMELIKGVLETANAPMVNHFLIKLQLTVGGICDQYFEGFDPEAKAMIEGYVRNTLPQSTRDKL